MPNNAQAYEDIIRVNLVVLWPEILLLFFFFLGLIFDFVPLVDV